MAPTPKATTVDRRGERASEAHRCASNSASDAAPRGTRSRRARRQLPPRLGTSRLRRSDARSRPARTTTCPVRTRSTPRSARCCTWCPDGPRRRMRGCRPTRYPTRAVHSHRRRSLPRLPSSTARPMTCCSTARMPTSTHPKVVLGNRLTISSRDPRRNTQLSVRPTADEGQPLECASRDTINKRTP